MPDTRETLAIDGIGYQGHTIDSFLAELTSLNVSALVDVRLTPISRKKGFSKRSLAEAAASASIQYEHLPALGNPKDNRAGFAGTHTELANARARYRSLLDTDAAAHDIARIRELARTGTVALLCFETDQQRCHRQVLLDMLGEVSTIITSSVTD